MIEFMTLNQQTQMSVTHFPPEQLMLTYVILQRNTPTDFTLILACISSFPPSLAHLQVLMHPLIFLPAVSLYLLTNL